jgi:8-oxo-dGTP pyrophosphatase MutT (NUDIX family)
MKTNMQAALVFGSPEPDDLYTERRAAYVVIINDGMVASVKSRHKYFLPGGGSSSGEAPEKTVVREVYEELGQGVRLIRKVGEAIQKKERKRRYILPSV